MQRDPKATTPRPKRQVRFPGLMSAAYELKCHRNHLYLVLAGKRRSHSLLRRYQEWSAKQPKESFEAAAMGTSNTEHRTSNIERKEAA